LLKNEPELVCKVVISPLAQTELDNIFAYISGHNYNAAIKFFEKLAKQFRLLSVNQKLGKSCDSYIIGLRSFPYKSYLIFYFPIEKGIEIYRVIHGARDIDDLFDEIIEGLKP
jgi:toxin ParE1/3/4